MADHAGLKLQPLDYVQHQCWGLDRMRRGGGENLPDFGLEDNIDFSTDYPHLDVKYPHAVESF